MEEVEEFPKEELFYSEVNEKEICVYKTDDNPKESMFYVEQD
jgi:hypothetical protein